MDKISFIAGLVHLALFIFVHMSMLLCVPISLFSLLTIIQLYYYIRYFRLLAFYKNKAIDAQMEHAVSVIVCARDEADEIEVNLPGILVQSYRSTHEVVVVNDNSHDDTKYLLDGLYKQFKQLHILELKQEAVHIPGKKFPLSMGIKAAKYELLLLTDADCVPASEHWLKKMQDAFVPGIEIVLGYGAYKKKKGILNLLVRFDAFHTAIQYLSSALGGKPYMGVGRNLAYKKELFFRHKGFATHRHFSGGDDDLFINGASTRTNTAVVIDPDAFTYSSAPSSWNEWVIQKERHNTAGKFYKGKDRWRLGCYVVSHFLYYPVFVAALLTFDWRWVLAIFFCKMLTQGIVFGRSMKKLGESDLLPFYWIWDIWMFFYYFIFVSSLWKKPKAQWN
jgi:glycosyltransferase involved in cell wall biosynthesis